MYISGLEDDSGLYGAVIAKNNLAHGTLIYGEQVSPRLSVARFRSTHFNVTVTTVCAPVLLAEVTANGLLYSELQDSVNRIPRL